MTAGDGVCLIGAEQIPLGIALSGQLQLNHYTVHPADRKAPFSEKNTLAKDWR